MPVGQDDFRSCLGRWPFGVKSRSGERVHGMTASDFCGGAYRGLGDGQGESLGRSIDQTDQRSTNPSCISFIPNTRSEAYTTLKKTVSLMR